MTDGPAWMLVALIAAHFYLDYAGQGDFMAKAKNPTAAIPGVPFYQPLIAHAFLHGAAAGFITGWLPIVLLETVHHAITDYAKCRGWISYNFDQTAHILAKIAWWLVVTS